MVFEAIIHIKELHKGASRAKIASHIKSNYNNLARGAQFNTCLRKALHDGILRGVLEFGETKQRFKITDLGIKESNAPNLSEKWYKTEETEKERNQNSNSKMKQKVSAKKKSKPKRKQKVSTEKESNLRLSHKSYENRSRQKSKSTKVEIQTSSKPKRKQAIIRKPRNVPSILRKQSFWDKFKFKDHRQIPNNAVASKTAKNTDKSNQNDSLPPDLSHELETYFD